MNTVRIMDAMAMDRALTRMAHEIVEQNPDAGTLAFAGILTRGDALGKRIAAKVSAILNRPFQAGTLDIFMHRDDLDLRPTRPASGTSHLGFDVTGKTIVLVDDVLFTGRSVRAALDELNDFGRPERIQLAVLIDRGHRELPVRADFVGKNVPTSRQERVRVLVNEVDGQDGVVIEK
jgi:pyrimidine operon attenuation protein/uracil phosphoribosyltransferase